MCLKTHAWEEDLPREEGVQKERREADHSNLTERYNGIVQNKVYLDIHVRQMLKHHVYKSKKHGKYNLSTVQTKNKNTIH